MSARVPEAHATACADIYKLVEARVSTDLIERSIESTADKLSQDDVACLTQLGVPANVVAQVAEVVERERQPKLRDEEPAAESSDAVRRSQDSVKDVEVDNSEASTDGVPDSSWLSNRDDDQRMATGELVVRVEPPGEAVNVELFWRRSGPANDSTWTPLEPDGSEGFGGSMIAGLVDILVRPTDPRIAIISDTVEVAAGGRTETTVAATRLAAATLLVANLDSSLTYSVTLPTGEVRSVESGMDIPTGAGAGVWTVDWTEGVESQTGSLNVEPGRASLPLPRAVEMTSTAWSGPQRWLLSTGEEPETITVQPVIKDTASFAVSISALKPGELRQIRLDVDKVPALKHHAAMVNARKAWRTSRRKVWISGGSTVVLGGMMGLALTQARTTASEAKELSAPDEAGTYASLVQQTASSDRLATIGLWSCLAGTGLTATFTSQSLRKAQALKARVAEFEAARTVPYPVHAPQSAGGGER